MASPSSLSSRRKPRHCSPLWSGSQYLEVVRGVDLVADRAGALWWEGVDGPVSAAVGVSAQMQHSIRKGVTC